MLESFINLSATTKVQLLLTSAAIINGSLSGMNMCVGFKYKSRAWIAMIVITILALTINQILSVEILQSCYV